MKNFLKNNWKTIVLVLLAIVLLIIVLLERSCIGNYIGIGGNKKTENAPVVKPPVKMVDKDHLVLPPGCELKDGDTAYWIVTCPTPEAQCGDTAYWEKFQLTVHDAVCQAKCDCPTCNKKKPPTGKKPPETGRRTPSTLPTEEACFKTRVITSAVPVSGIYLTGLDNSQTRIVSPSASCSGRRCNFAPTKRIVVRMPCDARLGSFNLVTASGQWSVDTTGASQQGSDEVSAPHYGVEVDNQPQHRTVKARGGDWAYDGDNPQGTQVHNTGDEPVIDADAP